MRRDSRDRNNFDYLDIGNLIVMKDWQKVNFFPTVKTFSQQCVCVGKSQLDQNREKQFKRQLKSSPMELNIEKNSCMGKKKVTSNKQDANKQPNTSSSSTSPNPYKLDTSAQCTINI